MRDADRVPQPVCWMRDASSFLAWAVHAVRPLYVMRPDLCMTCPSSRAEPRRKVFPFHELASIMKWRRKREHCLLGWCSSVDRMQRLESRPRTPLARGRLHPGKGAHIVVAMHLIGSQAASFVRSGDAVGKRPSDSRRITSAHDLLHAVRLLDITVLRT